MNDYLLEAKEFFENLEPLLLIGDMFRLLKEVIFLSASTEIFFKGDCFLLKTLK